MKLAIDLLCTKLNSGSKTFNFNFCKYLSKKKLKYQTYVYLTNTLYLQLSDELEKNKNIKYVVKSDLYNNSFFRILWIQFIFPFQLKLNKVDILYSSLNISPLILNLLKIKNILTLHSNLPWLYFKEMPGPYLKKKFTKFLMKYSIFLCDHLIVNSYFAKDEIIKILKLKKKINVVYLGVDHFYKYNNKTKFLIKKFDYKKEYILSVLSCVRYHNILNIIKAIKNLKETKNINLHLVLVTQVLDEEYFQEIKNFVDQNNLNQNITFKYNIDNNYLIELYKNSKLYIFTSYCEVFGLTSLEAMSQGCNVLLSNTSALKEINANSADYFDPDDINNISTKILKNLYDLNHRRFILENSKIHLKKFSWSNTVNQTLNIIENTDLIN